jgi:ABC-type glycerol-3-phosphate transport system substrate-binding protein
MKKITKAAIGGAALLFTIAACSAGSDTATDSPSVSDTAVSSGIGANDATADVKVLGKKATTEYGIAKVPVKVTNNSAKASDYWITVAAESKDGDEQYATTSTFIERLRPGQTKTDEAVFLDEVPADAVFVLYEVQRTASI